MSQKMNSRQGRTAASLDGRTSGPSVQSQVYRNPTPAPVDVSSSIEAFGATLGNFFGRAAQRIDQKKNVAIEELNEEARQVGSKHFAQTYQDFEEYYNTLGNETDAFVAWDHFKQEQDIGELDSQTARKEFDKLANSYMGQLEMKRGAARAEVQRLERNQSITDNLYAVMMNDGGASTDAYLAAVDAYSFNNAIGKSQAKSEVMSDVVARLKDDHPEEAVRLMETPGTGMGENSFATSFPEEFEKFSQDIVNAQISTNGFYAAKEAERIQDEIDRGLESLMGATEDEAAEWFATRLNEIEDFENQQGSTMNADADRMYDDLRRLQSDWASEQVSFDHLEVLMSGDPRNQPGFDPAKISESLNLLPKWMEQNGLSVIGTPAEAGVQLGRLHKVDQETRRQVGTALKGGGPASVNAATFLYVAASQGSDGGYPSLSNIQSTASIFVDDAESRDQIISMLNRVVTSGYDLASEEGKAAFMEMMAEEKEAERKLGGKKPYSLTTILDVDNNMEADTKVRDAASEVADELGYGSNYFITPGMTYEINRRLAQRMTINPNLDVSLELQNISRDVITNSSVLIKGDKGELMPRPKVAVGPNSVMTVGNAEYNPKTGRNENTTETAIGHFRDIAKWTESDSEMIHMESFNASGGYYEITDGGLPIIIEDVDDIVNFPYLDVVDIGGGKLKVVYKPVWRSTQDILNERRSAAQQKQEAVKDLKPGQGLLQDSIDRVQGYTEEVTGE